MLNSEEIVDKIKEISKERGYSLTFLYKQLNLPTAYLRDVNAGKTALTNERIKIMADFLNTTPEYLKGETDIKEKVTANGDDLSDREKELLKAFRSLSDEEQELFLKMFAASQK